MQHYQILCHSLSNCPIYGADRVSSDPIGRELNGKVAVLDETGHYLVIALVGAMHVVIYEESHYVPAPQR